ERAKRRRRNLKRRLIAYGTIVGLIVGFYYYQPQRYHFFADKPPKPNPRIDPDSAKLFSKGVKIALIQAHPDDSEYFLAPLLLRLKASGAEIHQLVMTDGDKSFYFWKKEDAAENRRVREAEQMEAASHYAADVTFLHKPDGRLEYQGDNADQVHAYLEKVQPDYVLCFDPTYWGKVNHADHLASGRAAVNALRSPGGVPSVKWVLFFSTVGTNFTPDVSNTIDQGIEMLAIHKSQFNGERLERIKDGRLDAYYNAGEAANVGYGVALRAVPIEKLTAKG
ncbi:MAG: PIG-L family deacetylase, partial [Armatimonadota bacterium]